jgi:hypothetical protein
VTQPNRALARKRARSARIFSLRGYALCESFFLAGFDVRPKSQPSHLIMIHYIGTRRLRNSPDEILIALRVRSCPSVGETLLESLPENLVYGTIHLRRQARETSYRTCFSCRASTDWRRRGIRISLLCAPRGRAAFSNSAPSRLGCERR